jgi:hypothetical protein
MLPENTPAPDILWSLDEAVLTCLVNPNVFNRYYPPVGFLSGLTRSMKGAWVQMDAVPIST